MTPPSARAVVKKAKAIAVAEYADSWVAQRTLKPRTRSMYRDLLRLHITPVLGDIAVKHLTADAVRRGSPRWAPPTRAATATPMGCCTPSAPPPSPTNCSTATPAICPAEQPAAQAREPVILSA